MSADDLFCVRGRTALVTGASAGIGLHVARMLAGRGAAVALAARRVDAVAAAARELAAGGARAAAVFLDVTRPETIAPAFDAAHAQLGAPVDVLVNNAGVLYAERLLDQQPAAIDRVFDTNLKGALLVAQEAARRMIAAGRGAIVNVSSSAGLRAGSHMAAYGASKAGLVHMSGIMALELASKNVRVNVLCPGNIETAMQDTFVEKGFRETLLRRTPMRRFGTVDDLDGAVLLLVSDAGRYMTGAVIAVDGGQTLAWM